MVLKITGKASQASNIAARSRIAFETVGEVIINRPTHDVFSYVSNLHNSAQISDHLIDTRVLKEGTGIGGLYARRLIIHGFKAAQTVSVSEFERDRLFQTSTELFGVSVVQTYRFSSDGGGLTKIRILKQSFRKSWADGMYQPFVTHQLTRPEHDGQHLDFLKRAVESA